VAGKIAASSGMAAYDLDELFWDSAAPTYGVRANPQKRDQALAALVRQEDWVIEGAYYNWVTPSFERADLILLLTPSVWRRDWRLLKRFALQRLGRSSSRKRETFASLVGLIRWNHTYDQHVLLPARVLLARLNKHPIECRTLAQVLAVVAEERPSSSVSRP
jgi:hypothetical protein